jgi:hypothetical protein
MRNRMQHPKVKIYVCSFLLPSGPANVYVCVSYFSYVTPTLPTTQKVSGGNEDKEVLSHGNQTSRLEPYNGIPDLMNMNLKS